MEWWELFTLTSPCIIFNRGRALYIHPSNLNHKEEQQCKIHISPDRGLLLEFCILNPVNTWQSQGSDNNLTGRLTASCSASVDTSEQEKMLFCFYSYWSLTAMTTAAFWLAGYEAICQDSWQLRLEILQWRDVSVSPSVVKETSSNESRSAAKEWMNFWPVLKDRACGWEYVWVKLMRDGQKGDFSLGGRNVSCGRYS